MKKEPMVGRRLYAWIIDIMIFLVFVFFVDGMVSTPIMNKTTDIQKVVESYKINSEVFEELQDEYEIYIYVEDYRVLNDDITEEKKQEFANDERVILISNTLCEEQKMLLTTMAIRISLSILVVSIFVYIVLPLIIGKGRTVGKLIAKLVMVNKNKEYSKWYQVVVRYLLSIIFNIYLAIITIGIVPLINLIIAIGTKDNQTLYDKLSKVTIEDGKLPLEIKYRDY